MSPRRKTLARLAFVLGAVALVLVAARASANPLRAAWSTIASPSAGPARVFGRHAAACITGAVALPFEGEGYQALDLSRRRYYGHPVLVAMIRELGRNVAAARLGTMLVGDMAQPRGGPMASGHVSHQGGLDVDIWFRLDVGPLPRERRDGLAQPPVVDPETRRPDPSRWTERHAELVRLAAIDPRVSRVFVGASIKRDLCEREWDDRSWLGKVRPWPGHDDHLHVRLRCPEGSPECVDQPELPSGEFCGAALEPWLAREREPYVPREPRRMLPRACRELLAR